MENHEPVADDFADSFLDFTHAGDSSAEKFPVDFQDVLGVSNADPGGDVARGLAADGQAAGADESQNLQQQNLMLQELLTQLQQQLHEPHFGNAAAVPMTPTTSAIHALENLELLSPLNSPALTADIHANVPINNFFMEPAATRMPHPYLNAASKSSRTSIGVSGRPSAVASRKTSPVPRSGSSSGKHANSVPASPAALYPSSAASSCFPSPMFPADTSYCGGNQGFASVDFVPGLTPAMSASSVGSTTMPMLSLPDAAGNQTLPSVNHGAIHPITPASLMKLDESAMTMGDALNLKPVVSGTDGTKVVLTEMARAQLRDRSNYENRAAGNSASLGLTYVEDSVESTADMRKSYHKLAEQRRRNCIKSCFEDLKGVLPNLTEKTPSKLHILQKTFEYLCALQAKQQETEKEVARLTLELDKARKR